MRRRPTAGLTELVFLELEVFRDARGTFVETYRRDRYREAGIDVEFVQDNLSTSVAGTVRGLHYRVGTPEGKLVTCVRGEIFDVAVDIRRSSATFGRWFGATLSAENRRQLWIPPGFAHGFYAVTEADVAYKVTGYHTPGADRALLWCDPELAIAWPLRGDAPIVSAKDAAAPTFAASELLP
jgi:dTDP-4-dehydrorhamnose 3,5-epimerase